MINMSNAVSGRRRRFLFLTGVMTLTAGLIHATPVSAEVTEAAQAADVSEVVADMAGVVDGAVLVDINTGFVANTTEGSVTIPDDAAGAIQIDGGVGEVSIGIPGGASADAVLVGDDVVYNDVAKGTNIVAQATDEGGAQILITIDSAQAPKTFDFPVAVPEGASLTLNSDGSVSLTLQGEELGQFDTPWAVDANGNNVDTHFTINGPTLTQTVNHDTANVAYPVVADPKFSSSWWGYTVKLTTSELKKVDGALLAGAGASAVGAALCEGSTAGLCALPLALGAAVITFGRGAIKLCSNSKGVDIHASKVGGAVWCSGY